MGRDSWGRSTGSEWRETSLGSITKFLSGGTPSKGRATYWNGSVPWVSAKDMKRFRLYDTEDHVTTEGATNGTTLVPAGTVLLLVRGMTLLNDVPVCVTKQTMTFNQDVKALRPESGVDDDFLPYLLLGNKRRLLSLVDLAGHGTGRLNSEELRALDIQLPPEAEQRAIAHILGTLDDKIELSRRTNETLEEMARTLFKSWFIDFDPVHAKAALKRHAAAQITPPLRGSRQAKGDSPQASRWGDHAATHPPRRWAEIKRQYSPQTLQRAQALRQNQTNAEGLLWHYLSRKQLAGYRFRRQQPIGPYIADFACLSEKLLIELDGGQHAERTASDNRRDRFLQEKGYRVLRFWNHEVFENCFGVLERIYAALPHHPPLEGGPKDGSLSGRGSPPPPQPAPSGLASATPPPGGSDWTVERAQAYLDGMDPGIAALFPDRFVDSELGEIPAGWEETTVDKIALLNPETWTARNAPQTVVYVDLSNTKWGTIEKCETHEWKDAPSRAKRVLRIGDTILGTVRPGNGSYAFIGEDGLTGSTGFAVLRPRVPRDRTLVWCYATASENIDRLTHLADGAAYPAVRPQVVGATKIILPSERVRNVFATICDPLLDQMEANKLESRTLVALRDVLLPKLISGDLRLIGREEG